MKTNATKNQDDYASMFAESTKLEIQGEYTGYKNKHKMFCTLCHHVFESSPQSRMQLFRKYGTVGCPECAKARREAETSVTRAANLAKIKELGLEVLTEDYDGRRVYAGSPDGKIKLFNPATGQIFYSRPDNVINKGITGSYIHNEDAE